MNRISGIKLLKFFQRFKIVIQKVLVRVRGSNNGNNAVNQLVSRKDQPVFFIYQSHLPKGMSL